MTDYKKTEALKNTNASKEIIQVIPNVFSSLWKSPLVKTAVYIGFGIGALYAGRLILDQVTAGVLSVKNFKAACKSQ